MPDILKKGDVGEIVLGPLNIRNMPSKTDKYSAAIGTVEVGDIFTVESVKEVSPTMIYAFVDFERKRPGNPPKGWIAMIEGKISYVRPTEKEQDHEN